MKFQCFSKEEVEMLTRRLAPYAYTTTNVIDHVDEEGKFKDIRKINIGLSKKALLSHRPKCKGAFYNCFVANVRVHVGGQFKEFHTKVFNTGKVEVPGIQTDEELYSVIGVLVRSVQPIAAVDHVKGSEQIVLINSNFNVNYYLRRDRLYALLRTKHEVCAVYDPCSYPGIQCTLYCRDGAVCTTPGGVKVAVMIFRTGSVLIVGKCAERELKLVYEYLSAVFAEEYADIRDANSFQAAKKKQKKKRYKEIVQLS
jgi:TATA-box binding protein (TBP) (component of TFIID and TFIIIB)